MCKITLPNEFKDNLRKAAEDYIRNYQASKTSKDLLRPPLLCFTDADSERFVEIAKIVDGHVLPRDVLPSAKTVITIFLPISATAAADNEDGLLGSKEWLEAFDLLEPLNGQFAQFIASEIIATGYEAAVPVRGAHRKLPVRNREMVAETRRVGGRARNFWNQQYAYNQIGLRRKALLACNVG